MGAISKSDNHSISPLLIKAYRQASFVVLFQDREIKLHIGRVSHELKAVMSDGGVTCAAFLTAFNPFSDALSQEENEANQVKLVADLDALGVKCFPGAGRDDSDIWPEEPSILVLGISLQNAEILADRYGQNAFVWIANLDGLVSLRLRHPIAMPNLTEAEQWILGLPAHLQKPSRALPLSELAWFMTVPEGELEHWLDPSTWNLNTPWPLACPDGSAIGAGSELDRVFRLIAAGVQKFI